MSIEAPIVTLESGDPVIQAQVDSARDLAEYANLALNHQIETANQLAQNVAQVQVYYTGRLGDNLRTPENVFVRAGADFALYRSMAELVMPARSAFETAKSAQEADESLATPEVWDAMSREQQAFTLEARTALAAGQLKEHGVTEESLRVVQTEVDGKSKFTLIHTGAGVDVGNSRKQYDKARSGPAVMSHKNDKLFQFEVSGATYDGRKGMKPEVYDAKVEDARARGVTLPDSHELSQETGDDWTYTMMTGLLSDKGVDAVGFVPIRRVYDGEVDRRVRLPDYDYRNVRVCPAVEIPDLTS